MNGQKNANIAPKSIEASQVDRELIVRDRERQVQANPRLGSLEGPTELSRMLQSVDRALNSLIN